MVVIVLVFLFPFFFLFPFNPLFILNHLDVFFFHLSGTISKSSFLQIDKRRWLSKSYKRISDTMVLPRITWALHLVLFSYRSHNKYMNIGVYLNSNIFIFYWLFRNYRRRHPSGVYVVLLCIWTSMADGLTCESGILFHWFWSLGTFMYTHVYVIIHNYHYITQTFIFTKSSESSVFWWYDRNCVYNNMIIAIALLAVFVYIVTAMNIHNMY